MNFASVANSSSESASSIPLIEQAFIRATIPGTSISSSYMDIRNDSAKAITLLKVTGDISPRIEMHQHTMVDGMMRMRKVESIEIESKSRVKLQPSGLHLMIFDVKTALKPEQEVELTLHFSNNVSVTMQIPVYSPAQEKLAKNTMLEMHEHHH
jgi:copper(I)-binding protein